MKARGKRRDEDKYHISLLAFSKHASNCKVMRRQQQMQNIGRKDMKEGRIPLMCTVEAGTRAWKKGTKCKRVSLL